MGRIHNKQFEDHVIGGQFAGGNLYLLKSNGVTAVVSSGQQRPVNDKRFNQVSVKQNSDHIVSGEFQGSDLVLTKNSGDTIIIGGGVPNTTLPSLLGNTVHSEQNCESIIGGSIDGGTITLFKLCGDDIVITGYTNTYPDTVGFDVVTTTTTIPPTTTTTTLRAFDPTTTTTTTLSPIDPTTTTTTVGEVTTTTTFSGQSFKRISERSVVRINNVDVFRPSDYRNDREGFYCTLVDAINVGDPLVNNWSASGSTKKYFGEFQVGTQIYSFSENMDIYKNGFYLMSISGSSVYGSADHLMVEFVDGVVQSIVNVGRNVYTYSDGTVQGEIYTNNDLYGNCP